MATGVDQPGGVPGTSPITVEDDAASANGLYYTFAEVFASPYGADFPGLGTTPESYRGIVQLVNGDGVGSATTTIKETNATLICDAGRPITVNPIGSPNRYLIFGEKIVGPNGKPSGKSGCRLVFEGSAVSWSGTVQLYGCQVRCSGTFNYFPGTSGLEGEFVDTIIDCGGSMSLGLPSTGKVKLLFNLDITLTGASTTTVNNLNSDYAERITLFGNTQRLLFTGNSVRVRDIIFGGSPTVSDVRIASATNQWDLAEPIWSGNATQADSSLANSTYINEWWRYLPVSLEGTTGLRVEAVPIKVLDIDLAEVLPLTYTDSEGRIAYGASDLITENCLKVRRGKRTSSVWAWEKRGPFTVRVNMDGVTLPQYAGYEKKFDFSFISQTGGDQYRPLFDVLWLDPPVVAAPQEPILVEDVPAAVPSELRFQVAVPSE